jgi:hypothetical protein
MNIRLSWQPVGDYTDYVVFIEDREPTNPDFLRGSSPHKVYVRGTSLWWNGTGSPGSNTPWGGSRYAWSVAVNVSGAPAASGYFHTPGPSIVTVLSPGAEQAGWIQRDPHVVLTWTAIAEVDDYHVVVTDRTPPEFAYLTHWFGDNRSGAQTSYDLSVMHPGKLVPGHIYCWVVEGYNHAGRGQPGVEEKTGVVDGYWGPVSKRLCFDYRPDGPQPRSPGLPMGAAQIADSHIDFRWEDTVAADSHRFTLMDQTTGVQLLKPNITSGDSLIVRTFGAGLSPDQNLTASSFTPTLELTAGHTYCWNVAAFYKDDAIKDVGIFRRPDNYPKHTWSAPSQSFCFDYVPPVHPTLQKIVNLGVTIAVAGYATLFLIGLPKGPDRAAGYNGLCSIILFGMRNLWISEPWLLKSTLFGFAMVILAISGICIVFYQLWRVFYPKATKFPE